MKDAERVKAIRERLAKATNRPWKASSYKNCVELVGADGTAICNKSYFSQGRTHNEENDYRFIANAPDDIEYLLSLITPSTTAGDSTGAEESNPTKVLELAWRLANEIEKCWTDNGIYQRGRVVEKLNRAIQSAITSAVSEERERVAVLERALNEIQEMEPDDDCESMKYMYAQLYHEMKKAAAKALSADQEV
jgi:hypothetical protein